MWTAHPGINKARTGRVPGGGHVLSLACSEHPAISSAWEQARMDSRQQLIDDVARQYGPSVVVLNLDEVQACERSSPMVTSHPRGAFTDIDRSADPGGFVRV